MNLAARLWPDHSVEDLMAEFSKIISKGNAQFFLRYEDDEPIGFAQCQLRHDYVEGTETPPVGYLEGIFVEGNHRGKGHAKALLNACEAWARQNGCREFASDCEIGNASSLRFHQAAGFKEANRIVCFAKTL